MDVTEQLLVKLKECVSENDYPNLSVNTGLDNIPFLKNESGYLYGADKFYKFAFGEFDVRFYRRDIGKFVTIGELGDLIVRKQRRKKILNDPNKKHIVYSAAHKDGREYIGKTSVGLDRRKWQHINDAKKGKGGLFQYALKELGEQNFEWKIEAEGNKKEIERREMELIAKRRPFFNRQYIDFDALDYYKKQDAASKLFQKKQQEYFDKHGEWPSFGSSIDIQLSIEADNEIFGR